MAAGRVPPLADDEGAQLGAGALSARSTIRTPITTPRPRIRRKKQSLDEVDPKLLETYKKLGIPLHEQMALAGVAVDAVFDSAFRSPPPSRKS